jgi:hypothetical protein
MVRLSLLPRRLAAMPGVRKPTPTYRELYNATVNGVIEAVWENGRWYIDEANVPAIALKLQPVAVAVIDAAITDDAHANTPKPLTLAWEAESC